MTLATRLVLGQGVEIAGIIEPTALGAQLRRLRRRRPRLHGSSCASAIDACWWARKQLAETLAALDVRLSAEDTARLEKIFDPAQVAGARYDAEQMAMLDTEREP